MVKNNILNKIKFKKFNKQEKIFYSLFGVYFLTTIIIISALIFKFPSLKEAVSNERKIAAVSNEFKIAYDIYPETEKPPSLTFYWGENKNIDIDVDEIIETIPYGGWSNGDPKKNSKAEPQTGLELRLTAKKNPIYSYCSGTVVWRNINASKDTDLTIRYGKKYAVKYYRVAEVPSYLNVGDKVKKGDLLGYTSTFDETDTFDVWKIEVDKVISDRAARALNPIDFFDDASKEVFEKIDSDISKKLTADPKSKDAGWIVYVKKDEIWASMIRMGFRKEGLESAGEFSKENNLGWMLNKEWLN